MEQLQIRCTGCRSVMEMSTILDPQKRHNLMCTQCDNDKMIFSHNVDLRCILCNKEKRAARGAVTKVRCDCHPDAKLWLMQVPEDQTPPAVEQEADSIEYINRMSEELAEVTAERNKLKSDVERLSRSLSDRSHELAEAVAKADETEEKLLDAEKQVELLQGEIETLKAVEEESKPDTDTPLQKKGTTKKKGARRKKIGGAKNNQDDDES